MRARRKGMGVWTGRLARMSWRALVIRTLPSYHHSREALAESQLAAAKAQADEAILAAAEVAAAEMSTAVHQAKEEAEARAEARLRNAVAEAAVEAAAEAEALT